MLVAMLNVKTDFRKPNYNSLNIIDEVISKVELDILVGPEWFFVPEDRIYQPDEYQNLKESLEKLSFRKLLIPGSILRLNEEGYYQNTALVLTDGKTIKEYSKRVDGGDKILFEKFNIDWKEGKTDGLFEWNNLYCGIEICADHSLSSLYNDAVKKFVPLAKQGKIKNERYLDLHFLIAYGNIYIPDCDVSNENGYFLRCDGFLEPDTQVIRNNKLIERIDRKEIRNTKVDIYQIEL